MPPHEHQNHTLREMDTLLQEMKHLNAGHAPDHMPVGLGGFGSMIKKATGMNDKVWDSMTDEEKMNALRNSMSDLISQIKDWHKDSLDPVKEALEKSSIANHYLMMYKKKDNQDLYNVPTKKNTSPGA